MKVTIYYKELSKKKTYPINGLKILNICKIKKE